MLNNEQIKNILKNHGVDFVFNNGSYFIIENYEVVEKINYKNINSFFKIRKFLNY